ncbi:hypothetical protein AS594_35275 [Streptomyces agglomeratus]|uniref:Peptidase C14 caspase domain-containing protein n=1 Tax=Streptomyces agglomeratus TaxID=285458 RepID=A0A1E5PHH2_9ACTN|nr:PQQ-binding-like beta-propeller repeat protein [Streptomyces agglomeratus]OEJ28905.1 hypothetical protein AS594_35275 [Streptomyces agglomeratus]
MPVPDPARSRAVLIGIEAYRHPDLEPLPAAAAGARRLAALLRDHTVWGLSAGNVTELGSEASAPQILRAVLEAAEQATDTLLVYFAGHGLRDHDERLYLALADASADRPEIGTLLYRTLRNVVRQAGYKAQYRLTILDCCFSGLAGAMTVTAVPSRAELAYALDEPTADQAEDLDDYGDCVLTSAPPTRRSFVQRGARFPEFTGELINVLEHGITAAGPTVSVEAVWKRIRRRMQERGSPEPQQFAQNTVARQIQFHNRATDPRPRPWRFRCRDSSVWRLAVTGGLVCVRDEAECVALNAATGSARWTHTTEPKSGWWGPEFPQFVAEGGTVYVSDGARVRAMDAATGTALWEFNPRGQPDYCTVDVASRTAYVISRYSELVPMRAPLIGVLTEWRVEAVALNAATGTVLWAQKVDTDGSLTVSGGVLYVTDDRQVRVVDAQTGTELRRHAIPGAFARWPTRVASDEAIYLSSRPGVAALAASTGETVWTHVTATSWDFPPLVVNGELLSLSEQPEPSDSIALSHRTLYVNHGPYMLALDASTGTKLWTHYLDNGNGIFWEAGAAGGTVYAGASTGDVYAWEAATGTQLWARHIGGQEFSPPVATNGLVYIRTSDGFVYALDAETGLGPP